MKRRHQGTSRETGAVLQRVQTLPALESADQFLLFFRRVPAEGVAHLVEDQAHIAVGLRHRSRRIFWTPLRSGRPSSWLQRRNFPANAGMDKYHYAEHAFRQASTVAQCGLVAKNKGYPSDLTAAQWELIEPLVPTPQGGWPSADAFSAPDRGLGTVKCLLGARIDA